MEFGSQLSVSKQGTIKFGSTTLHHRDLDHFQSMIWSEVNRLQWTFASVPIWLVGETIHVWFNRTTYNFHWSDTDVIEVMLHEYREPDDLGQLP